MDDWRRQKWRTGSCCNSGINLRGVADPRRNLRKFLLKKFLGSFSISTRCLSCPTPKLVLSFPSPPHFFSPDWSSPVFYPPVFMLLVSSSDYTPDSSHLDMQLQRSPSPLYLHIQPDKHMQTASVKSRLSGSYQARQQQARQVHRCKPCKEETLNKQRNNSVRSTTVLQRHDLQQCPLLQAFGQCALQQYLVAVKSRGGQKNRAWSSERWSQGPVKPKASAN